MRRRAAACCCGPQPTTCAAWIGACLGQPPRVVTVVFETVYTLTEYPSCDDGTVQTDQVRSRFTKRLQGSVSGTWNGGSSIAVSGDATAQVRNESFQSDAPPPGPCYPWYLCSDEQRNWVCPLSGSLSCFGGFAPNDNRWFLQVAGFGSCTYLLQFSTACGSTSSSSSASGQIELGVRFLPGSGCAPTNDDVDYADSNNTYARANCDTVGIGTFTFENFDNDYGGFRETQVANLQVLIS